MRYVLAALMLLTFVGQLSAADPLVQRYLNSARFDEGEQALEAALEANPKDDEARFGLGVLQVAHGIQRLGQSLYQYGAHSDNTNMLFVRMPVPHNPDPAPISYPQFRRMLDDFRRDLETAERTLAEVKDVDVKLPLKLAEIRLDLTASGRPNESLLSIMKRVMARQNFEFLHDNPDFLVVFDRGDVAWLRAYCHLLMGLIDGYLAFDTEETFDLYSEDWFAHPKHPFNGSQSEKWRRLDFASREISIVEPRRLHRFRLHMIAVADLNWETWKFVRAETDDDHEWLPNPHQKGVFGMPVSDERINNWLGMMSELKRLLEGERTILGFSRNNDDKGLSLKLLLDDPPEKISLALFNDFDAKYWVARREVDYQMIFRVLGMFGNPTDVAYAAWFN